MPKEQCEKNHECITFKKANYIYCENGDCSSQISWRHWPNNKKLNNTWRDSLGLQSRAVTHRAVPGTERVNSVIHGPPHATVRIPEILSQERSDNEYRPCNMAPYTASMRLILWYCTRDNRWFFLLEALSRALSWSEEHQRECASASVSVGM